MNPEKTIRKKALNPMRKTAPLLGVKYLFSNTYLSTERLTAARFCERQRYGGNEFSCRQAQAGLKAWALRVLSTFAARISDLNALSMKHRA
jgi:hypothetical protein